MFIKFIPRRLNFDYQIDPSGAISGLDLSVFPEGAAFTGSEETRHLGIFGVENVEGELYVTLCQSGLGYECQPADGNHFWHEGDWIDAADYDPERCYIVATSAPDDAEYVKRDNGWTVTVPAQEEETIDE